MKPSAFTARADVGLAWSVKSSFLHYVRGRPDGDIRWRGGTALTSTGEFYFPLETVARRDAGTIAQFRGEVRFTAHGGLLSVSIARPSVRLCGGAAELSTRIGDAAEVIATIELAPLIAHGGVLMWHNCPVRLAPNGAEIFGPSYRPGEPMAPLTLRLPATARTRPESLNS